MSKAQANDYIDDAVESGDESEAPGWLVALAKAGYIARGVIYCIIGSLAFLKAFGNQGDNTDSKGAITQVLEAPGGAIILWAIAIGLIGYSAWRICQSILDADDHGTDAKGLAIRAGLFVSAITHALIAYYAVTVATSLGSQSSGGSSSESLVARILGWPGGRWIVGLIALCILGVAVAHAIKGYKETYRKRFSLDPANMDRLNLVCKFGLYARGVAFAIISGMFFVAATQQDSDDAGGLKEVLDKTAEQPYGAYLLAILAAGLFAFGIYSILEGLYRRINRPG